MIPDEISDFAELEKSVKESGLKYKDALIEHYKKLGERLGYTARENASVIRNTINYGKLDLVWVEPNITFTSEFGNSEELLKHLWRIIEFSPKTAVLLLSSKAGCKPEEALKIIEKSSITEGKRDIFLILDVGVGRVIRAP